MPKRKEKKPVFQIPDKALFEDELLIPVAPTGTGPAKSGHVVRERLFARETGIVRTIGDHKGESKRGFFKKCVETPGKNYYPTILAQYSVALSHLYRMSLGERAAEERLVYSREGKIVGSVSFALEDFMPMQARFESSSSDKSKARIVNPSIQLLKSRDAASVLMASWRHREDDMHHGNMGTATTAEGEALICRIDFDMSWYNETGPIRGKRFTEGWYTDHAHNASKLLVQDLDDFPNIKGTRIHWPTRLPKHGYAIKGFEAQDAFFHLGDRTPTGEETDFHDQMHFAMLKELLSYQPSVIRNRLHALLGDAPLGISDLPGKQELVETNIHSHFYDEDEEERKLVEHFLLAEDENYQNFYNIAVKEYTGLRRYLIRHPEAFEKAKAWFEKQNARINPLPKRKKASRAETLAYEHPFDIESLEKQYLRIWQDSVLQEVWFGLKELQSITARLVTFQSEKSKKRRFKESPRHTSTSVISHAPTLEDLKPVNTQQLDKLDKAIETLSSCYQLVRERLEAIEEDDNPTIEKNKDIYRYLSASFQTAKDAVEDIDNLGKLEKECTETFKRWDSIIKHVNYEAHVQARKQKLKEASVDYQYGSSTYDIAPERQKPKPKIHTIPCPATTTRILTSLTDWLDTYEDEKIITAGQQALRDYGSQAGAALRNTLGSWGASFGLGGLVSENRTQKIHDTLTDSKLSLYEKLVTIFSHGGWDANSYNTLFLKKMLSMMVHQSSAAFKSQEEHDIVNALAQNIKEAGTEDEVLSKHIGNLSKAIDEHLKAKIKAHEPESPSLTS